MTKQKHFFLFRGLIREARHWGEFPSLLKSVCPDCKVTSIDIPGAGEYYRSPSPLSMKKMVESMRQEFLKIPKDDCEPILVAISLGGMIAAQWLKDYPQDFKAVALINTSYGGISPFFERLKLSALAHLLKVPLLKGRAKEARILKLVSNHGHLFDKNLDLWEEIQKERPVSLPNALRQLTAAACFSIGDFKPEVPVLILASKEDRMVNVACSRAIAKKWDATYNEHPTAGHDLSADDPLWIAEQVRDFLATLN